MFGHVLKFGRISSRGFGVIGVTFRGVYVKPNLQRPLAAKPCVGSEHVLEVQERYAPPLSLCQVWFGSDIARCQGAKKLDVCFFVCFVLFASQAFE